MIKKFFTNLKSKYLKLEAKFNKWLNSNFKTIIGVLVFFIFLEAISFIFLNKFYS